MEWTLFTKEDYVTTSWSGGTTTQLAIAPEGAVYADRDFLWRLSSAGVDLPHSDFTPLPDYNRLISILRGEMSIVGNRPLPLYEAELLTNDNYAERFMAPAGLTGLWQVEKRGDSGRLSAEERNQLDIRYAREFSFGMDLKILWKTLTAFVQKENV